MIDLKSKLTAMAGVPALVPLTGCSKSEKPHYGISFACWPGLTFFRHACTLHPNIRVI